MAQLRLCGCFYAASFYCFTLLSISAAHITDPSEVSALHAVKSSLSDPMKHLSNWKKGDPCTSNWTGVMCFDLIGADGYFHVQELQLLNMNLSGTLAPELGRLSHLKILDFMWNELSGSIPKEIANISSLKLLLLSGNKLSGSLPSELGYLSNLTRLQVDENQISGPIPNFFSKLSSVKHLHLNNNSITGQIPSELSNLSTLLHLVLENNNLSGYLPPEFSNLPELSLLQLDNNNFNSSHIPASYENFSRLVKLSLRNCSLEGGVPDLSRIATLKYIDLSNNQLSGRIPSNVLSQNMTTIDLSDNHLNGSIPEHFSYLPSLQKLSLENNDLSGSVVASIWQNKNFSSAAKLLIDLQNNSLSNILGDLNPPENISLRLQGNPICRNANIEHIVQFCGSEVGWYDLPGNLTNSSVTCPIQACPVDNYFEYVPQSPEPCFCASPLRIGYRLKSPSFSYFPTYAHPFEAYLTKSLNLSIYQLSIDSFIWEKGPRLRMYLKLFPMAGVQHSNTFNSSEIIRIRGIFTSWEFPSSDLFGPYELLNFTLLGPYSYVNLETQGKGIGKGVLIAVVVAAVAFTLAISVILTILITRKHARRQHKLSRRHPSSTVPIKIDGVKCFKFQEMRLATDNFNSSTQVGQGGYGNVYRGILSDNTIVAIKRAKGGSLQGQKEFLTEIEMLSRLHHRNLVSLLGYCDEEGEQMLVYEFMPNGTLQYWLSATCRETLNFGVRFRIALGSAKGILYLHTEADPPIFHRDIKASNILPDSKHTAKVADFGLSRLAPVQDDEGSLPDHVSTIVKGTPGYLDPEYLLTSKLTDKSDVYSLGVVFMELLTGMQPISRGKNIVREVSLAHKSGRLLSLLDSRMGSCPCECVERFFSLALRCCQDSQEERPSMLDVVRELENILPMMPESASASSSLVNSGGDTDRPFISSSTLSGSDLISGVTPTISPR